MGGKTNNLIFKIMAFNGTEGSFISLADGAEMTETFRNTFLGNGRTRKAIFFGKDKLMELLNQTDCVGIRCYFGGVVTTVDPKSSVVDYSLVLVGAKANENDMVGEMDKILDDGVPCPAQCGMANPLNPATVTTL
ncbi:hypothetical protein QQ054_17395 [Oscillatoria amoena NRMC-F 0135]|nr:hypothetical protein [Oscillatoria amoena NRMC-F 0135]